VTQGSGAVTASGTASPAGPGTSGPLLVGKTVVVSGAGGGIGRGIALSCAAHGAAVVIAARRLETGEAVSAEIAHRGGRALAVRCDVTLGSDVAAALDRTLDHFGAIDAIVHNALAPVGEPHMVEDVPEERWHAMMATGVRASFHFASAGLAPLADRGGTLILVTSAAGVEGSPYLPAYGTAKAAQRGMAKALAREWGPLGVRVNCIAPVAMTPAMEVAAANSPVFLEGRLMDRTPLRRIGEPEADIGPVAVFLVSDLSRYVTGQTIVADGGGFTGF